MNAGNKTKSLLYHIRACHFGTQHAVALCSLFLITCRRLARKHVIQHIFDFALLLFPEVLLASETIKGFHERRDITAKLAQGLLVMSLSTWASSWVGNDVKPKFVRNQSLFMVPGQNQRSQIVIIGKAGRTLGRRYLPPQTAADFDFEKVKKDVCKTEKGFCVSIFI